MPSLPDMMTPDAEGLARQEGQGGGHAPAEDANQDAFFEFLLRMGDNALILGHRTALPDDEIPDLLFNPLFILLVLSACILPEILIERRLEARRPYDRMLRFVSDRRPVTLDPAELLYVESNDSEVWLHTRTGEAYRTKTRISQWEALLDRRFLRIHRSYIVNTECIEEYHPTRIRIGGSDIEITRKYKEAVRRRLGPE